MGGLIFAAVLAWDLGADYAPILSGALCGFILANSLIITVLSNPSEIAIALCIIGVWCFMRDRYVFRSGIACLAASASPSKPQGCRHGLALLPVGRLGLSHGVPSKPFLATIAIAVPGVLWTWSVAPHWLGELHASIQDFSQHGGLFDPGPASKIAHTMIDLQVLLSLFKDDPHFYNPASYLVFAVLSVI